MCPQLPSSNGRMFPFQGKNVGSIPTGSAKGKMAEWLKHHLAKMKVRWNFVGSNPTFPAKRKDKCKNLIIYNNGYKVGL